MTDATTPAWAGIDPVSRRIVIIGADTPGTTEEMRRCGFIAIPCTAAMAQFHLNAGRPIVDLYALADRGRNLDDGGAS